LTSKENCLTVIAKNDLHIMALELSEDDRFQVYSAKSTTVSSREMIGRGCSSQKVAVAF
jgi:hypothetical protein